MKKECIAMLLAGGQGSRLGVLTRSVAKPAVPFGGKNRIIDFPLSNCVNSGIDTVGVLTQYRPLELNSYIGNGHPWDLDRIDGGVSILPPYMTGASGEWYKGTANAVCQNINFIDAFNPEYVLILSGDHIYKMNYAEMLDCHKRTNAACTIAIIRVPWEEASRFGIMSTDENGRITEFAEKPANPTSNTASMGVYIFSYSVLRRALLEDDADPSSANDFGGNIIPNLLNAGEKLQSYEYKGYWKDVGTIKSLWDANMDLLRDDSGITLRDPAWKVYGRNSGQPPQYIAEGAKIVGSSIAEGSSIYGNIVHSVIGYGAYVGPGAVVRDSVLMPGARVEAGAVVEYAMIAENAVIGQNAHVGAVGGEKSGIAVIGADVLLPEGSVVDPGAQIARGDLI